MAGEIQERNAAEYRSKKRRLMLGMVLGGVLVAAEATVGFLTHSLALISDAGHNLADIFAVGLALFAVYMSARPATGRRSYGFGRVGILTALANALGLVLIGCILVYEAIRRIQHVEPVSGASVILTAFIALLINGVVAVTLFRHRHDLSIKGAFLHQVTDAAVSLGVLASGLVISLTGWYYADPLAALLVSFFIFGAAWGIIREATDILLESVPRHIDMTEVRRVMESVEGVRAVHHLHVWELGSGVYALSGHVEVSDRLLSDCGGILSELQERLADELNIVHPTLQIECAPSCPTPPGGRCGPT